MAGTVISTAVLTGALVVGDSLRYSLGRLADIRLGEAHFAIMAKDRFFSQQLAGKLEEKVKASVVPVLQLDGIAVNTEKNLQINSIDVVGVDQHFMKLWKSTLPQPQDDEAILSRNAARKLNLHEGEEFLLKIHKQAKASENAPFVSEKEPLVVLRLKVKSIAEDEQMGRFSLKSNQSAPFNVFVSLPTLSTKLKLGENANLLLVAGDQQNGLDVRVLDSLLRLCWQPEDAGLEIRNTGRNKTYEIRSGRIFIDDNNREAIQQSIPAAEPLLTYLVNSIRLDGNSSPYSFVTAADSAYLGRKLTGNDIIISNWLAGDLGAKQGDWLTLRYFKMGPLRKLTEDSARFCVKSVIPIADPLFDRTLMPDFPGMSDAGNCRDWETGAPVNLKLIRDKDEQYWKDFRGTPKAFISLAAGQKLWDNAFGHVTAYRFQADSTSLPGIRSGLIKKLSPAGNGFSIRDIYAEGKSAASNSTDFGGLFLSLSFFIISAALLLTALLFSLHARKRIAETAVLASVGFRKNEIIRILFSEAFLVVFTGSLLGSFSGILYNKLILLGLNTLWQDAVRTTMLQTHLMPATLFTGFAAGVITALLALLVVLLRNLQKPLSVIVKGVEIPSPKINRRRYRISLAAALLLSGAALGLILYLCLSSRSYLSEPFLAAGGLILMAGINFLYVVLQPPGKKTANSFPAFLALILRNLRLKRQRTIIAIALLAIGTFTVIITGANRKTFTGTGNSRQSGTGGFLFWAESTVPILKDLNSPEGKEKYGLSDEPVLRNAQFEQLLRLDGNDASCLNLNQVTQPAILGINPIYLDKKQAFSFASLESTVDLKHPWLVLNAQLAPGIIPGFADQTVIQWGLRKNIGDTLLYRDESGKPLRVKIMGGLDNSIFQGNILVSSALFSRYFPSAVGSRVMLIDAETGANSKMPERLEYLFQDYGMMVTSAPERLAQFNSVENTYLSVFMMLGGLGVIIGTIGLGIVLLQSLAERKREIAR